MEPLKSPTVPLDAELVERVLAAVDADPEAPLSLLADLVRARSVNPWFGGDPDDQREARMQDALTPRLQALGAELDRWEFDAADLARYDGYPGYHADRDLTGRPNLVGRLRGAGGGRSLLLLGHADTVGLGPGWSVDPFAAVRRDGLLYGRGAVDMKGGMAAALAALELLDQLGVTLAGDVLFASVVDEETGGMGALSLVDRGYRADGAIIPEPTGLEIAPLCRGVLWCTIRIPGRAGHIEIPQPAWDHGGAVDAIALGRDLLTAIDELNARWRTDPRKRHPLQPVACQAIPSVIRAGALPSAWADGFELTLDVQYLPAERDDHQLGGNVKDQIEAAIREWARRHAWLRAEGITIDWPVDADCAEIPADHPLVTTTAACVAASGSPGVVRGSPFHTDMGLLVNAGIPTVNFGPGDPAIAHQVDEALPEAALAAATRAYALTIAAWCGVAS